MTLNDLRSLNDLMNSELNSDYSVDFPFYSKFITNFKDFYNIHDFKSAIGFSISLYRQLWIQLLRSQNSTELLYSDQMYLIDMTNEIYLRSTSKLINEYIEDLIFSELETGITIQILLFTIYCIALVASHLYLYFVLRITLEFELKSGINIIHSLPCKLRNYLIEVTLKACPSANQAHPQKSNETV